MFQGCMNLVASVKVILHDRLAKRLRAGQKA
ncbi:RNA methyltransferase [Aeromonas lusitana]|uniref:RNA methyltransferase n=1 Tax=Aeromonas lusitana TaxID=931529 RepID=A0A2M8H648_9GAMM|nr:RNA methyltransferase [Aeromonas lusitana]